MVLQETGTKTLRKNHLAMIARLQLGTADDLYTNSLQKYVADKTVTVPAAVGDDDDE